MNGKKNINIQFTDCLSAMQSLRSYLRRGCAAAIVGCGFSLNARKRDSKIAAPVQWKEFSNRFASELLGCKPDDKTKIEKYCEGKSPLVLSHEYESIFGRSAMIDVVKDLIHDENLLPDEIHESFLRLGWSDVYTTNYDTLLERTLDRMPEAAYRVVLNANQIVGSRERRIVKLHGTWDGPISDWIVTDEDYRKYPIRFAPFVNMVRQTCMESCLCLVGFSGTDPNFLSWIGWVRDNLGDAGYPIYLLTNRQLYQGEHEWFVKRRIIPIDIFAFTNVEPENYIQAFKEIFKYLGQQPISDSSPAKAGWEFLKTSAGKRDESISALRHWISAIHNYRKDYPGWSVAPASVREKIHGLSFFSVFEKALLLAEECFTNQEKIDAFSDLNWYLSLGLEIFTDDIYRINKRFFDHLRELKDVENAGDEHNEIDLTPCVDVCVSLLTCSREFGDDEQFNALEAYLRESMSFDKNLLLYERFLLAKRDIDVEVMEKVIYEWATLQKDVEWQVKYATALIALGRKGEARSLLISAIGEIRKNLPCGATPIEKRYLSLEGIALYVLLHLPGNTSEKDYVVFSQNMINARLSRLAAYGCDPREEIEKFKLMFNGRFEAPKVLSCERKFDQTLETWHFGGQVPDDCVAAGVVTHFFETTGIPLYVENDESFSKEWLDAFVQRYMFLYSSAATRLDWILAVSCENYKDCGISELSLCRMLPSQVERLLERCLKRINYIYDSLEKVSRVELHGVYIRMLKYSLEISSRLVAKVGNQRLIEETLDCGLRLYRDHSDKLRLFSNIIPDFFRRVESAMSVDVALRRLSDILVSLPSVETIGMFESERWYPITSLVHVQIGEKCKQPSVMLQKQISNFFYILREPTNSDIIYRDNLTKLCHCEYLGVLDVNQSKSLAKIVRRFINQKSDVVKDLSLSYISRLMRYFRNRKEIINQIAYESIKSLPNNLSFSSQCQNIYKNIEEVFGSRNARSASHCKMNDGTADALGKYVRDRFSQIASTLNDRDANSLFERTTFYDELHRLDILCGDVLLPYWKNDKIDVLAQIRKEISDQIDDRDLPLMHMICSRKENISDFSRFLRDFDIFASNGQMEHLLEALNFFVYQINSKNDCEYVVREFLIELLVYCKEDYFVGVCNALSVWGVKFGNFDSMFFGYEQTLWRINSETQFGNNRFGTESIMDKRASYSFLCGAIWGQLTRNVTLKGERVRKIVEALKSQMESGNELVRVSRAWTAGVAFGKASRNIKKDML